MVTIKFPSKSHNLYLRISKILNNRAGINLKKTKKKTLHIQVVLEK